MAHSILQPKPLNEWLKLLDRTALPVHARHKEQVLRVMANPNSSLGQISRVISEAPSIALILFRAANRSSNSLAEPAHNLNTVLKRLGMGRSISLLTSLKDEKHTPIPPALRQLWLIGQHANRHANALFAHPMARLWQEIHWGSLLFFSPLWPLLTRHPELFKVWEQRVLGNKEPAHLVEQELIGVPLTQLCHALAKRWSLPQWIIDGYATLSNDKKIMAQALYLSRLHEQPLEQQRRLDLNKELSYWLTQPANSIVLANGLALASHNSWGDNHSLRWQRLISLYLHKPLGDIQQKLHQTSAEHARYLGTTDLWHPANALLWPWPVQRIQPSKPAVKPASPVTAQPTPASQAESGQLDLPRWRSLAQQLMETPSPFRNTLQLLNHYTSMLKHGAFSRVLVLGIRHTSGDLFPVCQLNYGFPLQKALVDRITNPVFRHVTSHEEPLHINDQNHARATDHLDRDFLHQLASTNLSISCIRHNERPTLIVIADDWGHPLQDNSFKALKASNRYLEQALGLWNR